MEPNIKKVVVKKCASQKEARKELIKGLLTNEPMSLQVLVTILKNHPYELTSANITEALNKLHEEGLIIVEKFIVDSWLTSSGIDVILALTV